MTWTQALLLGLVEGLTEFLPISSTGHLLLLEHWLGIPTSPGKWFEITIQLGAIVAVAGRYFYWFLGLLPWRMPGHRPQARRLWLVLLCGVGPVVVVGGLWREIILDHWYTTSVVAWNLVLGGAVILAVERWRPFARVHALDRVGPWRSLWIGLCQILALFPGVSRSGATIMAGLSVGLSRSVASEFSFILSVPLMAGAVLLGMWKDPLVLASMAEHWPMALSATLVAFVTAYVTMGSLLRYIARHSFAVFGWYRIVLGLVFLLPLSIFS